MKLDEYLSAKSITDVAFAATIGRSPSSISRIRRGLVRPDWSTMDAIKAATNGDVTPNDFIPDLPLENVPPASPFPEAAQ